MLDYFKGTFVNHRLYMQIHIFIYIIIKLLGYFIKVDFRLTKPPLHMYNLQLYRWTIQL